MSVRDNLPTGSSRNKIEYLADCIDNASKEVANLLINPNFTAVSSDMPFRNSMRQYWMNTAIYSSATKVDKGLYMGNTGAIPSPAGWGMEVLPVTYTERSYYSGIVHTAYYFRELVMKDVTGKATFVFEDDYSLRHRVLHYSTFVAPHDETSNGYLNGHYVDDLNKVCHSVYLRCKKLSGKRFGIIRLFDDGSVAAISASKPIPDPANDDESSTAWIHDIRLKPGALYAFFIESDTEGQQYSCIPIETGVFANTSLEDIVPNQVPSPETLNQKREFEILGEFTRQQINDGVDLDLSMFRFPYGMEKHVLIRNCDSYLCGSESINAKALQTGFRTVRLQDTGFNSSSTTTKVYYSETPINIGYFTSSNYTAP
jgi:hypothetical protein